MQVSVLVPTYRRSKDLERCLEALKRQTHPADELLVVVRDTDEETHEFLRGFEVGDLPLKVVDVGMPGQVAALNAGLAVATGEVIAITDDDAAPHPDWLERIERHFLADDCLGGVGGRDWMYLNGVLQTELPSFNGHNVVGKLRWFGRAIGNHHLGMGDPREVDILKGVNMSYRRQAINNRYFNENLRGKGAQVHNDLDFSLAVKKLGWKIIYDPSVAVDHFLGERFDSDRRTFSFDRNAMVDAAHNETLIILNYLSNWQRLPFVMWSFFIGSRSSIGILQIVRLFPDERMLILHKFSASILGKYKGCLTWLLTTRLNCVW
jgi:cellulose synthase/poly-beta-1,6-N-acetylglucosamine synthase-like glycosyltransferase